MEENQSLINFNQYLTTERGLTKSEKLYLKDLYDLKKFKSFFGVFFQLFIFAVFGLLSTFFSVLIFHYMSLLNNPDSSDFSTYLNTSYFNIIFAFLLWFSFFGTLKLYRRKRKEASIYKKNIKSNFLELAPARYVSISNQPGESIPEEYSSVLHLEYSAKQNKGIVPLHSLLARPDTIAREQFIYMARQGSVILPHDFIIADNKLHVVKSETISWGEWPQRTSAILKNPDVENVILYSSPEKLIISGENLENKKFEQFILFLEKTFEEEQLNSIILFFYQKNKIPAKILIKLSKLVPNNVSVPVFFGNTDYSDDTFLNNPENISDLEKARIERITIYSEDFPSEIFFSFYKSLGDRSEEVLTEVLPKSMSKLNYNVFRIISEKFNLIRQNDRNITVPWVKFFVRILFGNYVIEDDQGFVAPNLDFSKENPFPFEMKSIIISPGADNLLVEKFLVWVENNVKPKQRKRIPLEIQPGVELPMNTVSALKNMLGNGK